VSLIGCQKDNLEVQPETEIERSSERKKKVKVCHCTGGNGGQDWKVIKVSKNALRAHLRHGDFKMKDKDGDGFYQENPCVPADQVDCDDWNYYANPNCPEDPTNGVDDNCDGVIDEGGGFDDACELVGSLDLNNITAGPGSYQEVITGLPFGDVTVYRIVTEFVDDQGTVFTETLQVMLGEQRWYSFDGSYYKNDGSLAGSGDGSGAFPTSGMVFDQFDPADEEGVCFTVFDAIVGEVGQ